MLHFLCVKDSAVGSFGEPMAVRSIALAERSFKDEVNRPSADNPMFNHPNDFELYHIGTYDSDSAAITPLERPALVARAVDLKNP